MLGFETIGNATLIAFDGKPVLVTDPWISDSAYFGSWRLPDLIPDEQRQSIKDTQYVWFSHGHPDHLNNDSLHYFTGKKILISDHVGGRIKFDLTNLGFDVQVLPERQWVQLSPKIKVMSISDYYQDAILLVDINGRLVVNLNDTGLRGNTTFIKKIIKSYGDKTFMLKLFGYGDVDMMNCYNQNGEFIEPIASINKKKRVLGPQVKFWTELYGVKYVIPFSCFHEYQRSDSIWANEFVTPIEAFYEGFESSRVELLPYYISYNCETDELTKIKTEPSPDLVLPPEKFGDNWSDELTKDDEAKVIKYFTAIESIHKNINFVKIKVGSKTLDINFAKGNNQRGLHFHVPRGSLMTAVTSEVFDDLLIGNFMKTTFEGDWKNLHLEKFTPYVGKYADNGYARTDAELKKYFYEYYKRAPKEFLTHQIFANTEQVFRNYCSPNSQVFQISKKIYSYLRSR